MPKNCRNCRNRNCNKRCKNEFCFTQKNLNSNVPNLATFTTDRTTNSWGIVAEPDITTVTNDCGCGCNENMGFSAFWVANNGNDSLDKYSGAGNFLQDVPVTGAAPTGLVAVPPNSFQGYQLITATEHGTIDAWDGITTATDIVVSSNPDTAVYKGLAITNTQLFVCNFRSGFVEIYDQLFALTGTFTDQGLVDSGYAPFNIVVHGDLLYVTFAKQDDDKEDDVKGDGFGYIDIFKMDGTFVKRFINREPLNAPWGMMFSQCKNLMYVGNFGDGRINVFNAETGEFIAPLTDKNGNIIVLDGLWGITGNDHNIAFAAGIDDEDNGLIGVLRKCC